MTKQSANKPSIRYFILGIVFCCLASVFLLVLRINSTNSLRYVFLIWNLLLAILPLFLAWVLASRIRRFGWQKWQQVVLTALWLSFLPNSFYLITDFVHLRETTEIGLFYDVVMLASFVVNGLLLGYIAVYLLHKEIIKRLSYAKSYLVIFTVFFLCSFAIYLGRFTRWNTWDIIFQPAGLLFDVSDRFINPDMHVETYVATGVLFVMLASVYTVIWEAARLIEQK